MTPPAIFDRNARRLRRDASAGKIEAFLTGLMVDELFDRLNAINRTFSAALVIGAEPRLVDELRMRGMDVDVIDPGRRRALLSGGRQGDEDDGTLPVSAYDLVIAIGTLDTVGDLPGALILIRRALRPDGAFLAAFPGAGSLPSLRSAATMADQDEGSAIARFHPQIDVRAVGDLLVRAGFALPVADVTRFDLAYKSIDRLLGDLRDASMRNVLATRHPVGKRWRMALDAGFSRLAGADGRTRETIALNILTAWAPAPGQPQPAQRGSATASLAAALKQSGDERD